MKNRVLLVIFVILMLTFSYASFINADVIRLWFNSNTYSPFSTNVVPENFKYYKQTLEDEYSLSLEFQQDIDENYSQSIRFGWSQLVVKESNSFGLAKIIRDPNTKMAQYKLSWVGKIYIMDRKNYFGPEISYITARRLSGENILYGNGLGLGIIFGGDFLDSFFNNLNWEYSYSYYGLFAANVEQHAPELNVNGTMFEKSSVDFSAHKFSLGYSF